MNKMLSCEFNIDAGNVELRYADGSMISINCTEVENEVAMSAPMIKCKKTPRKKCRNMAERREKR